MKKLKQFLEKVTPLGFRHILKGDFMDNIEFKKIVQEITSKYEVMYCKKNYYCNIRQTSFAGMMSPDDAAKYLDFLANGSREGLTSAELAGVEKADGTWHHHEDGVTLQEVETILHDRFRHRGGISNLKKK